MNTIKDIILTKNIAVDLSNTIKEALEVMYKNQQGVCVVLSNNLPIGILTERDVLQLININLNLNESIESILKFNHLITINVKRSVEYALQILISHNIRRLIVVNDANNFMGIITQDILIKHLENDTFKTSLLISDFIKDTKNLVCVDQDKSLLESFNIMNENNIGSIIVLDKDKKPIGIVTEKDTINIAINKVDLQIPINKIMTSPVITIKDDKKVEDVVSLMDEKNIRRVLVLDKNNSEPQSVLSVRDIAHNLKGNYSKILESNLRNVKNTLNYIGESVLEVCQDNNEHVIQWTNDTAIKNFGNIIDKNLSNIFENNKWTEIYKNIQQTGECIKYKIEINNMYFELRCTQHYTNERESLLLIFRDISEFEYAVIDANKKNKAVQKEVKILQGVIDQQKSIVFVSDGFEIISANKSLYNFFNVKNLKEFINSYKNISTTFIKHINFFSLEDKAENWITEILKLKPKDRIVSILDMNDFEPKAFTIQINPLDSDENEFAVTLTDITEIKLESQQYHFHATHDSLTSIYNRSYYFEKICNEIAQSKRYKTTFCVILFDIDHFKKFNDTYGHLKGDEVLIIISKTIKSHTRVSDTFARWGGEEFVILLEQTSIDKAELIAEHFRKLIEDIKIEGIEQVTSSFGVTQYCEMDDDNSILQRADEALYLAKEQGRNKVVVQL